MGCGGGKPQKPIQIQPPQGSLLEPILPSDITTPQQKLEYILSQKIQDYLKNKGSNYDQLINNLVDQMHIKRNEYLAYNHLLVEQFQKLINQHHHNVELLQFPVDFLSKELNQFVELEQFFKEADNQLQLKTFKFLIDLYLLLIEMKPGEEQAQYWSGDYMKKYEEKDHQIIQNHETNSNVQFLKQIETQLKQCVQKAIQILKQQQRQEQLQKISKSSDEVMSKTILIETESLVHYAREQNQKYTTPI